MNALLKSVLSSGVAILALSGCTATMFDAGVNDPFIESPDTAPNDLTEENVVGAYQYCDGYWTWEIGLRANGSFTFAHLTDTGSLEIDAVGKWHFVYGDAVSFSVENSGKIVQKSKYDLYSFGLGLGLTENPSRVLAGGKRSRRVFIRISEPVLTKLPNQPSSVKRTAATAGMSVAEQVTIFPGFIDTYRWHPYHLTKESPDSPDGVFRLVGVSKDGDAELIYLSLGEHIILKRRLKIREVMASKMPMKIDKSDFVSQSVDFEWLTTN